MKRLRRQFDEGFKQEAARVALWGMKPLTKIARDLNVHSSVLRGWIHKYKKDVQPSLNHNLGFIGLKQEHQIILEEHEFLKTVSARLYPT